VSKSAQPVNSTQLYEETMNELTEEECYEGVGVDLVFENQGPTFGDLFVICGYENPNFPPSKNFHFDKFSQIDDYFGVQTLSDEGDDVSVWLFPLVDGEVVDHNPGQQFSL